MGDSRSWWRVVVRGGGPSFVDGGGCSWWGVVAHGWGVVVRGRLGVWGRRPCGAWSSVGGHCCPRMRRGRPWGARCRPWGGVIVVRAWGAVIC